MNMKARFTTAAAIMVLAATGAFASLPASTEEDGKNYARAGAIEGGLLARHPGEDEASYLVRNDPVYPGMTLFAEGESRAAVELSDGTTLFLDSGAVVGVEALEGAGGKESAVLALDRGGMLVQKSSSSGDVVIYAGESGSARLMKSGLYRVDAFEEGSVRVASWDGTAKVASGASVRYVDAGYAATFRSYADIAEPQAMHGGKDSLAEWATERGYLDGRDPYDYENYAEGYGMSKQAARYARELELHGTWNYHPVYGTYVWAPLNVSAGWRPYYDGYWCPTPSGLFWVSHEPWGWAPYRYGRWMFTVDLGWVWIPGRVFAPAWVAWTHHGGYVGWCPLGFYGRASTTYWGLSLGGVYHSGWSFVNVGLFFHWGLPHWSVGFSYVYPFFPVSTATCGSSVVVAVVHHHHYGGGSGGGGGGGGGTPIGGIGIPRRPRDWQERAKNLPRDPGEAGRLARDPGARIPEARTGRLDSIRERAARDLGREPRPPVGAREGLASRIPPAMREGGAGNAREIGIGRDGRFGQPGGGVRTYPAPSPGVGGGGGGNVRFPGQEGFPGQGRGRDWGAFAPRPPASSTPGSWQAPPSGGVGLPVRGLPVRGLPGEGGPRPGRGMRFLEALGSAVGEAVSSGVISIGDAPAPGAGTPVVRDRAPRGKPAKNN